MAWNKPNSNTVDVTSSSRSSERGKIPRLRRGLLAGVIVVLGAGIAAWLFTNGEADSRPLQKTDRMLIKEVKPAVAPTNGVAGAVAKESVEPTEWRPKEKGFCRDKDGNLYRDGRKIELVKPERIKAPYEIFHHHSENVIAQLIFTEPGTVFFFEPRYTEKFVKNFEKSCEEPIIVSENDDEYTKYLKNAMKEVKIELCNRMHAGEDLAQILTETRKELKKLGEIKMDVERMVKKEMKNAQSEEDVETYVEAANKMLEEKGIAPIKMNPVLKQNLMRRAGLKYEPPQEEENSDGK